MHTYIHTYADAYIYIYIYIYTHTQVNNAFLDAIEELIAQLQSIMGGTRDDAPCACLVPGPIKKPERALQKLVRLYNRNPACLTDLVRCTVVAAGLKEAMGFLRLLGSRSVIGTSNACMEDVLGQVGGVEDLAKTMRITQLKNR